MSAAMDVAARLAELAKLPPATRPVVSVYLNTRWTDEDQRERVRIFLKNHLREARAAAGVRAADEDLDWIEAQGRRLIGQATFPDASGVVLFAGGDAGLREALPLRTAVEDAFVVEATPYLRPLAGAVDEALPALVVFVDGTSARLVALTPSGPGEEAALESDVEGRHATGGWAALAQSRYQRHIETHREQHYQAVGVAVAALADRHRVRRLVLAGEGRAVAALRRHLPAVLAVGVIGVVAGARHEATATIAARAAELLAHADEQLDAAGVDRVLDAAAKGGRAVAGVEPTLEAVNREAVQQLYLLTAFERPGAVCEGCGALQAPPAGPCRFCSAATRPTELGEAMVNRVLATGGSVSVVGRHAGLAGRDGVGALLRYAA
jgi:peptide subunit release factor 1 (eRF1)